MELDRKTLRKALRSWDQSKSLGESPLARLRVVDSKRRRTGYGETQVGFGIALREVLQEAIEALDKYTPQAIVSIERPGQAADGSYYNMRGENISARTACFDTFMNLSHCPTIAVGDGGNEIGMGKVIRAIRDLNIVPAVTGCDELIVSDVSNWGAYAIISFLSVWHGSDLLEEIDPPGILKYISELGGLDGVTRINRLTEDGLSPSEGESVLQELREVCGFAG